MKNYFIILTAILFSMNVNAQIKLDIQGHRGCRGLMPENTIQAMIKAIDLGVNTLEMDCVISADDKVVVSHDNYMSHEFVLQLDGKEISEQEEQKFNLYKMVYDSIAMYDAGSKVHPRFLQQQKFKVSKPLLSTLIDSVENYIRINNLKPIFYNIETKCSPEGDNVFHPEPEKFVDLLIGVIKSKKIESRVIVQSFDVRTLQVIHKRYPQFKTALLVENKDGFDVNMKRLGFVPTIYSPDFTFVDAALVKQVHAKKMQLIPWTANTAEDMQNLAALGVNGIISDYPNIAVEIFGRYQ